MPKGIDDEKCLCYSRRMDVSTALREAMDEAKWTTIQVARAADVSESAVWKWRNGAEPGTTAVIALMKLLPGFAPRLGFERVESHGGPRSVAV